MLEHIRRMAAYNAWMNTSVYGAAAKLPEEQLYAERDAFFGSIFGTLHHIAVGDRIWLSRFADHPDCHEALDPIRALPRPATLTTAVAADFAALLAHRKELDANISELADELSEADLAVVLTYASTKGVVSNKRFDGLLMHFFNHQTHHRGQASTMLSQAGVDIGPTDLLLLVPNEP